MKTGAQFESLYRGRALSIGSWCCTCPHPDRGAEEHTPFFEVVFLRAGAFVKHLGRRRTFADPNHVVFFNPGEGYRISHPVSGGDECTVFTLRGDLPRELLGPRSVEPDGGRPALRGDSAVVDSGSYSLHRQLLRCLVHGGKLDLLAVDEIATDLLQRVLAAASKVDGKYQPGERPGTRRDRQRAVDAVKQFLSAHSAEPLTLDDVAGATYYSKYHLARLFKLETGLPVHRYLNRLRLRIALERLMDPAEDLSKLALEVGFSSHSHFSNAFRLEFGRAPSELRRTARTPDLLQLSKNLTA